MAKFRSQEEYDDWRSHQAIKRQGAKDIEKMDAERPVYLSDRKNRGIGIWGLFVLLIFLAGVLSFTPPGRQVLTWFRSHSGL